MQGAGQGTSFSLKCIKDKRVPIGVTVVVAALLVAILALAVKKSPSCPPCPTPSHSGCREHGIGYRQRCFYFVEDAAEWNQSESFCQTLGAHLASIRTWEELRFLVRYGGSRHHWIGLRREGAAPWMWVNGTLFNNEFQVRGRGQCAFVDGDGISSDWCSLMKFSVCSHPQAGSRSDPEGWNLT
ncbi:C-type lectin domain family 2 member E-like [Melopsittacus undulatus]|uniref:C-type lectin domain family 2 member E-like n=1 Tax=Melopsittacus undulatus TaxID=13146 RepID=UPI00146E82D7|nr:C-type lectin domain family 2 member E-like [Melopsittacus undulatus]